MKANSQRTFCVYMLRDPRTMQVRYVGMSGNVKARFAAHRKSQPYDPLHEWVVELRQLQMLPVLDIRLTGLTKDQALRCESILVSNMRADFDLIQGYVSRKRNPKAQLQVAMAALEHLDAQGVEQVYLKAMSMLRRKARAAS